MILSFLSILVIIASAECFTNRIVGGYVVPIERFPYIVSLQVYRTHICGGSILNAKFIITAAHCVENRTPHTVKAGVADIKQPGIVRKIRKATMHPAYHSKLMEYDVAVLELESDLALIPNKVMPVELPAPGRTVPITAAIVIGWGDTLNHREDKTILRAVDLEIYTPEVCKSFRSLPLKPAMFCAGHISGKRDSCTGDSGGPLVINDVLYGLVSFGPIDCSSGIPGVYTNVPMVINWVNQIVASAMQPRFAEYII